jgi:hypothetical protein
MDKIGSLKILYENCVEHYTRARVRLMIQCEIKFHID